MTRIGTQMRVAGKRGALMRAGCELDTREAGDLYFGDIVKVIDEGTASNGAQRVRVQAPSGAKGWVSIKMLEDWTSADILDKDTVGATHKLTVLWQEEGTTLNSIPLEVPANATVADVKRSLQSITQVPWTCQNLTCRGVAMADPVSISSAGKAALIMTEKAGGATPAADAHKTGGHIAIGGSGSVAEDISSNGSSGHARPVAGHMAGRAGATARSARAVGTADDDDDDEDLTKEADDEELEAPIVEEVADGEEGAAEAPPPKKRKRMWMFIVYHGDKTARRLPHSVRLKCPRNGTWEQAVDGLALVKATFVARYNAVHAKRPSRPRRCIWSTASATSSPTTTCSPCM